MNRMPIPGWVRDFQHGGNEQEPSFIMTKSLTKADMDFRNQNRTSRVQGRRHGGLEVRVYTRSRFWFRLMLTRWDSTGSTLIKGSEYKVFLDRSFFLENDEVEMWGFRQGGQLCFVLGRSIIPPV